MRYFLLVMALLLLVVVPASAQDTTVTDDDVNAVASNLYCPVCENIPLDACGTAACQDWREEIRGMLARGMTSQQITDDFISRFGERVVGTPQDPLLRNLSLVTPWVITLLAAVVAVYVLLRRRRRLPEMDQGDDDEADSKRSRYKDLLEQDIAG
ncbi:MAG: cytochrome c-type biogenesis protein CcmH [Anaerolineae bacterium]|nr:cytochrome c-type biogenesis protein CcmH [Anaerolineae bacterium]